MKRLGLAAAAAILVSAGAARAAHVDETASRLPALADGTYGFAVGDVDGANGPDLLVLNQGQPRLLLNDGSGAFTDATGTNLPALTGPFIGGALADVDGVNGPDLVLIAPLGGHVLLLNNGTGAFSDASGNLPTLTSVGTAAALGDVDGDGDADLVITGRNGDDRLLLNNGAGVFTDATAGRLPAGTADSFGLTLFDANGDGGLDLYITTDGAQDRLLLNNKLGVFTDISVASLPAGATGGQGVAAGDLDGDGDQDLAVAAGADGLRLLNNAAGIFTAMAAPVVPEFATAVRLRDIDFEGSLDIILGTLGQDRLMINDGAGTFTDETASRLPADTDRTFGLVAPDVDQDLDFDIVQARHGGQNRLLINDIPAPRILVSVGPSYIEQNDTATVTVDTFDFDGVASTLVQILPPSGAPFFLTLSGGTEGTASFVPTLQGIYTIVVASTDTLSNTGNKTITFPVAPADLTAPSVALVLTVPPGLIEGQSVSVQATATDPGSPASGVNSLGVTINGTPVPLDSGGFGTYMTTTDGLHTVVATATDLAGNTGTNTQTFSAAQDLTPPTVTVVATPDPVDIVNPVSIVVTAVDDVSIASLELRAFGPGTDPSGDVVPLDGSLNGSYTPYVPGTYTFTAEAADPAGNTGTASDTVDAQGVPDVTPPTVSLVISPPTTIPGSPVTITVNATDDILVSSVSLTVNGVPQTLNGSNQATFTPVTIDTYAVAATATDPTGNVGNANDTFDAIDPASDTTPPTVAITTPTDNDEVGFLAEIIGTANDQLLSQYTLEYSPMGEGNWTTFHTDTQPVVANTLGTLNTGQLRNGMYDIRLTAADINGLVAQTQRTVAVSGEFKPGVFQISFTDMNLKVAGTPIEIKRHYDSRDRATSGDFGHGWSLEVVQKGEYRNNIPPGQDWYIQSGGPLGVANCGSSGPTTLHVTEIRLSDVEFYQFAAQVNMTPHISSICTATISFNQVGGVPGATLVSLSGSDVYSGSGGGGWYDDPGYLFDPLHLWEPANVRLTTIDGRIMDLNLSSGIFRIGDKNGNAISISSSGVTHTSGASISFTRDGLGRITAITDPLGNSVNYAYNASGDLITHTDRASNDTGFGYTGSHFLSTITDPLGNVVSAQTYNPDGTLASQTDADGNTSTFVHDTDNGTETITDRNGTVQILRYGPNGKVESAEKGSQELTYTYDANGNRATETDALGNTKTFTHNANNQLTSETDAESNVVTYTYDGSKRPETLSAEGKSVTFAYDGNGNPDSMTDGDGNTLQAFTYDAAGNPTQVTTAAGTYDMTYDANGNVLTMTGPNGISESTVYNANGWPTSKTVSQMVNGVLTNVTSTFVYDGNGNVTELTDGRGGITTFVYDGAGQKTSETDPNGNTTTYEYDARGNQTRINYPDGTFEISGYDLEDRLTSRSNRISNIANLLTNITFFQYDANDNLTQITNQDGTTRTYTYDAAGRRLTATDERSNTTTMTYDGIGRIETITDAGTGVRTLGYTGTGIRPTSDTDPLTHTTSYTFDHAIFGMERLIGTTYADGETTSQTWAQGNRIATMTDELGKVTTYAYDNAGNLISVTDAESNVTTYTYDGQGQRLTETDANSHTTSYRYDAGGNMIRRTLPLGQFETFTYDLNGNKLTHVDFNGDTTTFTYDSMNRVATKTLPNTDVLVYTYTDLGKIDTVTDPRGVTDFDYDNRGRLTMVTHPDASTISYTYDDAGNRVSVTAPTGVTTYTYDAMNRISTVTDPNSDVTTYTYDLVGNITRVDHANGTSTTVAYDNRNRATGITLLATDGVSVLAQHTYTLDAKGRRTQLAELGGRTVDYTYDAIDRLLTEDNGTLTTYTYDDVGNRLTRDVGGSLTSYTYDNNNRLTAAGGVSFGYDNNGNTTSMTDGGLTTTYTYDGLDRLVRVTSPTLVNTDFVYDHSGNRVQRDEAGTITNFVVDVNDPSGLSQVLAETDNLGAVQTGFVHGNDLLSMLRGGANDRYFHTDGLGSNRVLSDNTGAVTDTYDFQAFGAFDGVPTGSTPNDYLFAGEAFEPPAGAYYLRDRYMDPRLGRFLSMDKRPGDIRNPITLHRYLYANANPTNMVDPTGQFSMISVSISVAIIGTLAAIAVYNFIVKPAQEVYDEINTLMVEIPSMKLNKSTPKEDLGFQAPFNDDGEFDITELANAGDGSVGKSYSILEKMTQTAGQAVIQIHKRNSGIWLAYLPSADDSGIPGNYLDCGFNKYVKKQYGLGLLTGLSAAKNLSAATNIIGIYMSYFTFLTLAAETLDAWGMGRIPEQPEGGSCDAWDWW